MLVGDAARLINPLTGGGIANACISGKLAGEVAAEAVKRGDSSERVLQKYEKAWRGRLEKTLVRNWMAKEKLVSLNDETFGRIIETPAKKGTVIAEVPRAGEADVDHAVRAAEKAFESWKRMASRDRGKLMLKIATDMEAQSEELAKILSLETGNALRTQSRGEIAIAADLFRFYGGVASEQKGETVPLGEGVLCYSRREPIGVVAGIIPWNSPVLLGALKITMALTVGIAIQNFPEGAAVAMPIRALGVSRLRSSCSGSCPPRGADRRGGALPPERARPAGAGQALQHRQGWLRQYTHFPTHHVQECSPVCRPTPAL
jgi:hypothetical protein